MEYPQLFRLIRDYFHQDYDLDDEDPDEIIREFCQIKSQDAINQVIVDIDKFLLCYGESEALARNAFNKIFEPEAPIFTYHCRTTIEGLRTLKDLLRQGRGDNGSS